MNNLQNLVVFIKDEAELQQAREILEANGHCVDETYFFLSVSTYVNFLYLPYTSNYWCLSNKLDGQIQITLTELEQKLKENRDENT